MRVLIISNLYGQLSKGGAEIIAAKQAEQYKNQGQEVIILTSAPHFTSMPINQNQQTGVYVYSPRNLKVYYQLGTLPKILRYWWHIWDTLNPQPYKVFKDWLKIIKPDLIITHNLKGLGLTLTKAIIESKIAWHHICHDVQLLLPSGLLWWGREAQLNFWLNRVYQSICRRLFDSPNKVIFPSRWLAELYKNYRFFPKSSVEVTIPYVTAPQPQPSNSKELKLLFIGQIEKHKGINWLVQVWPQLKSILSVPATLHVIGDGSQLNYLKKITNNDQTIKWLGKVEHQLLAGRMRDYDLLIVPSICYENLPTVIIEAYQVGLPVVASRIGGISEVVPNNMTFTPQRVQELAGVINIIMSH